MAKLPIFDGSYANAFLIDEMYGKYLENPQKIDVSWRYFFDEIDYEQLQESSIDSINYYPQLQEDSSEDLRVYNLIQAYRTYGHLLAQVNPIGIHSTEIPPPLQLENFRLSENDFSKLFSTFGLLKEQKAPLESILKHLKEVYCGNIGIEYMGLQRPELEEWLQSHIEPSKCRIDLSIDQKQMILQHLNKSELFESFIHTKYVGQKRFSLEGAETLIPMLEAILEKGADLGTEEFVIGMAHRGRLNVLSNILKKSYQDIFSEFEEGYIPDSFEGSGDVKYHKGYYSEGLSVNQHTIKVILPPNPSHLESVDPVVEGQVRAKQDQKNDETREKVIPILIHGDAAISGQGVVYETMQFYKLPGYCTGGTLHIVINNQIGFTTIPSDARSTFYCTDIARTFSAPVFHVNAEDPESCVYAINLAIELRHRFHCDVIVDLVCYRKYGHNEGDEPAFTQPLEYQIIRKKKPIREIYRDHLIHQGWVEKQLAESLEEEFKKGLQEALNFIKKLPKENSQAKENSQEQAKGHLEELVYVPLQTGVAKNILQEIGKRYATVPESFNIHPKLQNLLKERLSMLEEGEKTKLIDWGMAETLAYGSLLWEGISIRLSGQDCGRGTFSHRHAMWVDQVVERAYYPLKYLKADQGNFNVFNSSLSEYAVLGFEFGYSVAAPNDLVIWEAQFGDFCNGAQIIIDQYIATAEQKWGQKFGLVLYLPHGYEGQGPEHSSGRMERFLILCGNDNMQVVNPTTPAQLFHLLRRQMFLPSKKPLIVFTPKGLLRLPACVSHLDDLVKGSFEEVLDDLEANSQVKKLIFCSGRIYYDLVAARETSKKEETAIIRIEQLYPLNLQRLRKIIEKYAHVEKYFWVQEEPCNMGAWDFIHPLLSKLISKELEYVGRPRSASPAVGSHALHKEQHAAIIDALFGKNKKIDQDISEITNLAEHFKA